MHRFFLPDTILQPGEIGLPDSISRQINRVLRLKPGIQIVLLDNQGFEYPANLTEVNDTRCTASILRRQSAEGEPETRVTLLIGLTQREKFELILQKCTEIGVTTFQPFISSRTLIQKNKDVEDKYPRWNKILLEAAEQSHRGRIPQLLPTLPYQAAVSIQAETSLKLLLWEEENQSQIKSALHGAHNMGISLIIGPEGGLSSDEAETAKKCGFVPVSLGKRILRMETAAILAAGLVNYELE